jgi:hypothetical protein
MIIFLSSKILSHIYYASTSKLKIKSNTMTAKITKKYWTILPVLLMILFYLLWGPLFPWNPIKIVYQEIKTSKATLYIKSYIKNPADYQNIFAEVFSVQLSEFLKKYNLNLMM